MTLIWSQLTRTQQILFVLVGVVVISSVIAGLYFGFLKKDTPKPKINATPPVVNPPVVNPAITGGATPPVVTPKTINNDPIIIESIRHDPKNPSTPIQHKIILVDDYKQEILNTKGSDEKEIGCWSLNYSGYFAGFNGCTVTSITLPADVSATVYTTNDGELDNICGKTKVADIKPNETSTFAVGKVCGFKFTRV